jgi:hypothetical protein
MIVLRLTPSLLIRGIIPCHLLIIMHVHQHAWLVLSVAVLVFDILLVPLALLRGHVWRLIQFALTMWPASLELHLLLVGQLRLDAVDALLLHQLLLHAFALSRVWVVLRDASSLGEAGDAIVVRLYHDVAVSLVGSLLV